MRARCASSRQSLCDTSRSTQRRWRRITRALCLDPADVLEAHHIDNGPHWIGVKLPSSAACASTSTPTNPGCDVASVRDLFFGFIGPYPDGVNADGEKLANEVRAFVFADIGEDPVTGSLNAGFAKWLEATGGQPGNGFWTTKAVAVPLLLAVVDGLRLERAGARRDAVVDGARELVGALLDVELRDELFGSVGVGVVDVAVELGVALVLAELDLKVAARATLGPLQVAVDGDKVLRALEAGGVETVLGHGVVDPSWHASRPQG
ncbi:hypothetical protein L1887_62009 [Cichorium endivia]|nr:hypothetical protein L1887_62009 [Cichorium endivia]